MYFWKVSHLISMRHFFVIVFCGFCATSFAQWKGWVLSKEDSLPVHGAWVILNDSYSTYTDSAGKFVFELAKLNSVSNTLSIIGVGFESLVNKQVERQKGDQVFYLTQEDYIETTLDIIEGPNLVWGSEVWNVGDFCWDENGDLIILTYEEEERWKRQEHAKKTLLKGSQLLRLDKRTSRGIHAVNDVRLFQTIHIPGTALGFYDQFPGEILVECLEGFYLLHHDTLQWDLISLPDSVMKRNIKPVVDTIRRKNFIISDFESSYPAFDYFIHDKDQWHSFYHIQDEKEMELFRSEYKYLGPKEKVEAYQFELDHGVDKEVVAAYMRGFQHSHYHQPLYAPLVVMGDTIWVFDHIHHQVHSFSSKGESTRVHKIQYHLQKGAGKWIGKIWKDGVTQRIYTAYKKSGSISIYEIFPSEERFEFCIQLTHAYIEKIKIRGGDIYYIYKPFESTKNRYLYKEKIP